jgi:flagellar M-ring protein FliF
MKKTLANLSTRQRITIVILAVLVGAGLFSLVSWRKEADFKPLFTSLAPEDANRIVVKLKESGTEYRLTDGGATVLAPSTRLNELRLTMAAAGLPKTGRVGFELFDKLNLGATEFTEHINYRRALEGELERTVMSLSEVDQARVHLTFSKDSVFLESQQPAKASILVRLKPGRKLAPQNVIAINHLVASAVEGLSADAVTVLDMNGNLLGRPKPAAGIDGPEPSAATLDYRHQVEADLMTKIASTLGPLLGPEKFRAGVNVECDFSGGEQSEEIFDPARSVMLSSQRTEDGSGAATAAGVPGTGSTLPRPTSRPASGSSRVTRTTENVTYQSSRTVKKMRLPAGSVKRLSVSVLVDQDVSWEKNGNAFKRVMVPPAPEKLKVIRDLVAGIIGFSEERGDQLVIETLPFELTLQSEPPASATPPAGPGGPAAGEKGTPIPGLPFKLNQKQVMIAGSVAAGVLALAVIGFFLMRRRRKKKPVAATAAPAVQAAAGPASTTAIEAGAGASVDVEKRIEDQFAERAALQKQRDEQTLASLKLAPVITKKAEVFAKHLREKIAQEPEVSIQILRSWIREEEN